MLKHDVFEEFQSAYKANHSTETTLLKVFNVIILILDSASGIFLIWLDLSAAFDIIDYDVLCDFLQCHMGNVVLHWTFYVYFFISALNQLVLI